MAWAGLWGVGIRLMVAATPHANMAATAARVTARILERLSYILLLVLAAALLGEAADPPPVTVLATVFRGSGCRQPDDIAVRTSFDEAGGLIRIMFPTPFTAVTGTTGRTVRLACNGVIPLSIEPGKRIGITQVRIAGHVIMASESSTALLTTEFFFPGERGPTTQKRFLYEDGSGAFELLDATGTVWSKCGGKQSFRVNAALLASGTDTQIAMEEGIGNNGDGVQYEVTVKDCVADARREL